MKKYIFLTIISIILLFTLTCDIYDKSIPEYLDKYTNTATVAEHAFTGGTISNPLGGVYSGLIKTSSTIDLALRNPKNYELFTYLDYFNGSKWVPFETRDNDPPSDYTNVVNTSTNFPGTTFTVKYNHTDNIRISATGKIGQSYKLRIKLQDKETQREFEPYELPIITCTDYPIEIAEGDITLGAAGDYSISVSWEETLRGDLADANRLTISCPALNITASYKRTFTGSTWDPWVSDPAGTSPAITVVGNNNSVTLDSSIRLQNESTYSVTFNTMNEAGVSPQQAATTKSFTVAPLDPVTISTIQGVTPPVAGATPVTAIIETAEFTGAVAWSPAASSAFAYGTVYTATITLTPKSGFSFTNVAANYFTVTGATTVSNLAGSRVVTAVFPATANQTINMLTISGVTPPVPGAVPVIAITETDQYSGTVAWNPAHSTFAFETVYTATITLTPKSGYTLTGVVSNTFMVSGAGATNPVNSGVITAVFPMTGGQTVTVGSQNGTITFGTTGTATFPVTTIYIADGLAGTITWYTDSTGTTTASVPTGVTPSITNVTSNAATVTMNTTAASPAGSYYFSVTIDGVRSNVATLTITLQTINIAAIQGITPPAAGAAPVTAITPTAQYTGTVTWSPNDNPFAYGVVYTATITLTAQPNYTFTGVAANYFTVASATTVTYAAGSNTITAVFPSTAPQPAVNVGAQNGTLTFGTAGTATFPVTTIYIADGLAGTITWYTGSDGLNSTYAPTGVSPTVSNVSNNTATATMNTTAASPAGSYYFSVTIDGVRSNVATLTITLQTINIAAIPGVTPPATGAIPVLTITETDQYTGTVSWSPNENPFTFNIRYEATITLTAKTGYTLTGVAANFFTVAGANSATNAVNSGVVTAAFPETTAPIDIAAIPGVTPPVTGATPVTAITPTTQYTGTVSWSPTVSGTFANGGVYTAIIYLTGNEGYVFEGVPENFFTVSGATEVQNNANSGVVLATFPAAAPPPAVSVGAQSNTIISGTAGTATFPVTTTSIANGQAGTITWYSDSTGLTSTSAPTGVSPSVSNVSNNTATVTMNTTSASPAGTYYFRVTIDGTQSNVATLTIALLNYTVTFDANSATSGLAPAQQIVSQGSSITLPGQGSLVRTGYAFSGWNTQPNGSGLTYAADSSYTPTGNITLYAKWDLIVEFTTIEGLITWLEDQPNNTPETPYYIAMNVSNIYDFNMIASLFGWPPDKYIHLDFSTSSMTGFSFDDFIDPGLLLLTGPVTTVGVTIGSSVTTIVTGNDLYCFPNLAVINVDSANPNYSSIDGILYNKAQTTLIRCPPGKIGTVTIPNTVTTIGYGAFQDCSKVTGTITIPSGVTNIGNNTFFRSGFSVINIHAAVTSIGTQVFGGNPNLTAINVDAANPNYSSNDGVLHNKDQTTLIAFPSGRGVTYNILSTVTIIGQFAFLNNDLIVEVIIPDSVTTIQASAFWACNSLTSIILPSSIATIGNYAFSQCYNLASVTFEGAIPSANYGTGSVEGDLRTKFYATDPTNGTPGTYTRVPPATVWTLQP